MSGDDQESGRLEAAECSSEEGVSLEGAYRANAYSRQTFRRIHPGAIELRIVGTGLRGLVLLVGACRSGVSQRCAADENFHQTYPLAAGGSFALENVNGSVQVEGWSRDEVEVSAVKTGQQRFARPGAGED